MFENKLLTKIIAVYMDNETKMKEIEKDVSQFDKKMK